MHCIVSLLVQFIKKDKTIRQTSLVKVVTSSESFHILAFKSLVETFSVTAVTEPLEKFLTQEG